ncbi:uncharacterized protein LOC123539820 [Mercenaria mercenaria]|uniref:uncharacterized protein LOC123539820 n=1 Tax=Mercenaria mercenaria TaxID=6596 RepID=UPI00234F0A18|nr:uncharacterized protein LOC123539820 [Mercenaria mercenaria]XP_053383209.1 uncharacterized protein LOC123539820 [Mercenaria mercenaria]
MTMMMSADYLTSLPVLLVSMVILVAIVLALVQCVCGKRKENSEPELTQAQSKHESTFLDAETLCKMQTEQNDVNGGHMDVETGITPLNTSMGSHNGTLHSRGNSVDITKADRRSGTSSGSSPRPATLSRELPDIPKPQTLDRGHHSTLPEIPSYTDSHHKGAYSTLPDTPTNSRSHANSLENHRKGGHSHSQLPEIPVTSHGSLNTSPVVHRQTGNVSTPVDSTKSKTMREKSSDMDDYDHIEEATKKKVRPRSDYDHVVIEGGEKKIILAKSKLNENDYAEVQNNDTYEQVPQDVTVIPVSKLGTTPQPKSPQKLSTKQVSKTNSFDDPYNRIKGDDTPYNRIKDDPPYNKIKENETPFKDDPYNKIKVDDPYNTVKDDLDDLDPYNTVNDVSSSARSSGRKKQRTTSFKGPVYDPYAMVVDEETERNVSNQTDPYARVGDTESELEDPYNKVVEENESITNVKAIPEYGDDDYATVNKATEVEYAKVNKSGNINKCDTELVRDTTPSPREEIIQDEYATVVKVKKLSAGSSSASTSAAAGAASSEPATVNVTVRASVVPTETANGAGNASTPPEPPRDYDESLDTDGDHYNTVALVSREASTNEQGLKKEPPYNKLSVRESLASMNARAASNTYEYVSEVDNLYATVDGSSGDGTVRQRRPQPDNTEPPTVDYYTEIDAPAPPSLDSLHETAKQHQDEIRRKTDKKPDYYNIEDGNQSQGQVIGHQRTPSGQGHFVQGHSRTPSGQGHFRTPSGEVMSSSFEGRVPMATAENVDLEYDPNYQSVQESKVTDIVSEFDPNYETVEEARANLRYEEINGARPKEKLIRPHIYEDPDAKRKYEVVKGETITEDGKIRAHVYEEVTVTNEARRTRQRVLNQHTYEEVTDVKGKDKKANHNQGQKAESSNSSGNQKKKGHERNSSGDWLLFGKRKSGDVKENKRKSEGKEEKRKSNDIGKK